MLTDVEREQWDRDPDEWPHTPPFHIFRALMDEDDNTWWRAGSGHGLNAYDAAIERVEELEGRLAEAWDEGWEAAWSPLSMHSLNAGPNPYRSA